MRRAAALGALAAGFVPVRARAQATISLRVAAAIQDTNAQAYYAQAAGFFTSAGLAVEILPFTSTGAIVSALVGGALDVATAGPLAVAAACEQGIPLRFVAPGAIYDERAPTTLLLTGRTSTLNGPRDLQGKTVATQSLHGLTEMSVAAWMNHAHADAASVKYVEMPGSVMPPALDRGQIDAAVVSEPSLAVARQTTRVLADVYAAIAKQWYISDWFVSQDWLAKNREAAHAFVRAITRTQAWANAHQAETAKILQSIAKLSDDTVARLVRPRFGTTFDPRLLQPVLDASARIGLTKGSISARQMIADL